MMKPKDIKRALSKTDPETPTRRDVIKADPETHKNGIAFGGRQFIPKHEYYAGRPSMYNQAMADEICDRLASGESLRTICRQDHMPNHSTVMRWVVQPDHPFCNQYRMARQAQMETLAGSMLDIAADAPRDGVEMMRARLLCDNIKWSAARLLPGVYGDRVMVDANVNQNIESFGPQAATQLANILVAAIKKREIVE